VLSARCNGSVMVGKSATPTTIGPKASIPLDAAVHSFGKQWWAPAIKPRAWKRAREGPPQVSTRHGITLCKVARSSPDSPYGFFLLQGRPANDRAEKGQLRMGRAR